MDLYRDEKTYDITVIGGGPTGLFTAFYAGMRQSSCKIIESMPQLGGQLAALYPEKFIYDVAGFPKVRAQELVDRLKEQVAHFETASALEEKVQSIEKKEDVFEITTDKGIHFSRTVIITAGVGAFEPRRLELEGAERFEKTNLHYFVDDLNKFAGQKVVVFGGGDSAVDWALMLEPIAEKVTLIHRRDKFRAHEHSVENLMKSKVNVLTPYDLHSIDGEDRIKKITIRNSKTEELVTEEVDAVIVNFGFISSLGPIKNWGLELEKGSIKVNTKMETNIPGVYAAGDIATYPGKIKLIAVGFGEAPTAVNNAKSYMDPDAKVQPAHSSSLKM
ncbi:NAD(P)/FAD-dependent oxidoreductase [Aneurinibacillus sp. Ricciae_BoGa-3]|uniref:NAD(P)/FAD-dependent oxidoreductase n=1 Tax=Aneurinibacillus sp. Ricciae_BoGa-3 TaxID=3022697 RepID=UPI00233F9C6F|nr:NAD(P)/FAD-dependent oxidoreductase [Aneurinibacillus sp. Ricciae_BoGa-3]WCK53770.1 NAD(P)/FAD-dependent oxidoreductase [Aneurinibacillus sp. Ricciae_BoGa-3]